MVAFHKEPSAGPSEEVVLPAEPSEEARRNLKAALTGAAHEEQPHRLDLALLRPAVEAEALPLVEEVDFHLRFLPAAVSSPAER